MIMDRRRGYLYRLHIDPYLLGGSVLLCGVGLVVLFSADGQDLDIVIRQGARIIVGLFAMIALAQLSPKHFARWAPWLYSLGIILLITVMTIGSVGRGAQRWLDLGVLQFQPSELMKVFVPMMISWYLSDKGVSPALRHILVAAILIFIPVIMIAKQPDLGTAALISASGVFVVFFAGIQWRLIGTGVLVLLVCAPLLWFVMHDYQRLRLLTLFDPEKDPLGAGYHIIQSKIAVGSGGLYGKGWLNGTQSHLEFLPERATDFIFAVFCEEFGFMGVLVLLGIYLFVILRGLTIALQAQWTFARLLAGSLVLTFFVYIFINMSMVIGQLPVVGVPLPLISYGGTSLVTLLASFGILMSIQTHRKWLSE